MLDIEKLSEYCGNRPHVGGCSGCPVSNTKGWCRFFGLVPCDWRLDLIEAAARAIGAWHDPNSTGNAEPPAGQALSEPFGIPTGELAAHVGSAPQSRDGTQHVLGKMPDSMQSENVG